MTDQILDPLDLTTSHAQTVFVQKILAIAGLLFIAMGIISFGAAVFFVLQNYNYDTQLIGPPPPADPDADLIDLIAGENLRASFLLVVALVGSLLGAWLLRTALHSTKKIISDEDRALLVPLIQSNNAEAINQYVRLSSLAGGTGFFTKLGFTGLPLITAALGMILILLAMWEKDSPLSTELMDLAKLVLGAFIGSFVQRKVERSGNQKPEDQM